MVSSDGTRVMGPRAAALYSRPQIADWLVALYFFSVALLQSTPFWRYSTYVAYGTAAGFVIFLDTRRWANNYAIWAFLFLIAWMVFASIISKYAAGSMTSAWYDSKVMVMTILVLLRASSLPAVKLFLKAQVLGAAVVAGVGAFVGYDAVSYGGERVLGMAGQANAFGWAMSDATLSCLLLLPLVGKLWKLILGGYACVAFVGILGAASRSAALAAGSGILLYFLFEHARYLRRNLKWVIPMLLLLFAIPVTAVKLFPYSPLVARFTGEHLSARQWSQIVESDRSRLGMLTSTLDLVKERPIWGHGMGTYAAFSQFAYTHSGYAEMLLGCGVVGFSVYFGVLFVLLIWLGRLRKTCSGNDPMRKLLNASRAVVIALLIHCGFRVVPFEKMANMMFACILGLAAAVSRGVREEQASALSEPVEPVLCESPSLSS